MTIIERFPHTVLSKRSIAPPPVSSYHARMLVNNNADIARRPANMDGTFIDQQHSQQLDHLPAAIPCPYKYWWSYNTNINPSSFPTSNTVLHDKDVAYNAVPGVVLPNPEDYACICGYPQNMLLLLTSSTALQRVYTRVCGFQVVVQLTFAAGVVNTLTLTLSGPGGYSVTRAIDVTRGGHPMIVTMDVPVPWDVARELTVSWTSGTLSSISANVTGYMINRLVKRVQSLPNWIPNNEMPAVQANQVLALQYPMSVQDAFTRLRKNAVVEADDGMGGSYFLVRVVSENDLWIHTVHQHESANDVVTGPSLTNLLSFVREVEEIDVPPYTASHKPVLPDSVFAGCRGIPFVDSLGNWMRTNTSALSRVGSAIAGVCYRRIKFIYRVHHDSYAATITVKLSRFGSKWADCSHNYLGLPETVLYTRTFTYTDDGLVTDEYVEVNLVVGPHPDGALPGFVVYSGVRSATWVSAEILVFLDDEGIPPPYPVAVSDNTVIPGAFHLDAIVPIEAPTIIECDTDTFNFDTDIPPGTTGFMVCFTDVPQGYYVVEIYDPDDVFYTSMLITNRPVGFMSLSPGSTNYMQSAFVYEDGGRIYVLCDRFPITSLRVPNWNGPFVWTGFKMKRRAAFTVTPNLLALGLNTLNTNTTTWGLSVGSTWDAPFFQKFVAPATGRYRFRARTTSNALKGRRWGVWVSTTNSYGGGLDEQPYAIDDNIDYIPLTNNVLAPSNTPPVTGTTLVALIGNAPTGAWEGHAGEIAEYKVDTGIPVHEWTFSQVPFGTTVGFTTAPTSYYILTKNGWVDRATVDLLDFEYKLTVGETLFMRFKYIVMSAVQDTPIQVSHMTNNFTLEVTAL